MRRRPNRGSVDPLQSVLRNPPYGGWKTLRGGAVFSIGAFSAVRNGRELHQQVADLASLRIVRARRR